MFTQDFRSADGLYALVKSRYPNSFVTGRDLFSSGLFSQPETTALFYTFIAELSLACQAAKPTRTHHFLSRLERSGRLLRSYTQNVDGLERRIGLESHGRGKGLSKKHTRNVELHGDLGRVRCVLCSANFEAKREWVEMYREGEAPDCEACAARLDSRMKRGARATSIGTLRPAIVLYDEEHPYAADIGELQAYDMGRGPDVLLIMGTSLKVHGLRRLVKDFAKAVHAKKGLVVFVNATPPSKEWDGIIDVHVHGTTDRWVEKVEEDWRHMRPADWEQQTLLDGTVAQVASGSTSKSKGKSTAKPKKAPASGSKQPGAKPKATTKQIVQLPTPSPSRSPSLHPQDRSDCSSLSPAPSSDVEEDDADTVVTPPVLLSPPVSPSKRASSSAESPAKRSRATPPVTGVPSTPGRGNLFLSPAKTSSQCTVASMPESPTRQSTDPVKPIKGRAKKAVSSSQQEGKENVSPARPRLRAKPRASQKKVLIDAQARRRPLMASASLP